jgi:hypothetical protein
VADTLNNALALLRRLFSARRDPPLKAGVLRCGLQTLAAAVRVAHRYDALRPDYAAEADALLTGVLGRTDVTWKLHLPFLRDVLEEPATHDSALAPALACAAEVARTGRRTARRKSAAGAPEDETSEQDRSLKLDAALAFVAWCAGAEVEPPSHHDQVEDPFTRESGLPLVPGLREQLRLVVTDASKAMKDAADMGAVSRLWCAASALSALPPPHELPAAGADISSELAAADACEKALLAALRALHQRGQAELAQDLPLSAPLSAATGACMIALDRQQSSDGAWLTAPETTALYEALVEHYPAATPILAAAAGHFRLVAAIADGRGGEAASTKKRASVILGTKRLLQLLPKLASCLHSSVAGQRRWALELLTAFQMPAWEQDDRAQQGNSGEADFWPHVGL